MRKVKYQAWDQKEKFMLSWNVLVAQFNLNNVLLRPEPCGLKLREYTGLKDKNGVEIYDGDIDQAENGDKNVIVFLLKAGTYCVMPMDIYLNNDYQNEAFSQEFMYGFGYDLFFDNLTPGKYLNVIGNIYENPELLEETK